MNAALAAVGTQTPSTLRSAPVAQLDRASDYESEGRTFESFRAHQFSFYLLAVRYQLALGRILCCRV